MPEGSVLFWGTAVVILQILVVFGAVLLERREPSATLAWILAIVFLPIVGTVAYFLFGHRRARRERKGTAFLEARLDEALKTARLLNARRRSPVPEVDDTRTDGLVRLAAAEGGAWLSEDNEVEILDGAAATYRSFLLAFDDARHHIHALFYIFRDDETGKMILDRLIAAAKRGVQVRLLVDAVGSAALGDDALEPLLAAGGAVARYGPLRLERFLRRRDRIDYRNHRKLVIVDGTVGFTGGINVGREYLGFQPETEAELWRDTHVRLRGPAVHHIQRTFIADWSLTTQELPDLAPFFPETPPVDRERVLVVPSGPDQRWAPLQRMLTYGVNHASERVYVTSPYFVPDRPFLDALTTAALRGIDVRILVPRRSDHRLVGWASMGWYEPLVAAGVKLYLYDKGFIHAKTVVIDGWVSTVGSANMDIRSFHLNYELNVFVFGARFSGSLTDQFLVDLRDLDPLSLTDVRSWSYAKQMLAAVARLSSPFL